MVALAMSEVVEWVTTRRARERLGVSKLVLRRLIRMGEIRARRAPIDPRYWLLAAEDVERLARQKQQLHEA